MTKKIVILAGPVVLIAAAMASGADDKTPTIKDAMKINKGGPKSAAGQLKTKLSAASPDWESVQKTTKEFLGLAEALGKNEPPKGDDASWKKLSGLYAKDFKALNDAAKDKDKDAAQAAQKKIGASCKACHQAHRS